MPGNCRFCATPLKHVFVDLGMSPLSNSFLGKQDLERMESFYPLKTYVCETCKLVQLEEFQAPENIFKDYAYFSSYSDSWLAHAKKYTEMVIDRFALTQTQQIIEIASNDGYLLQYFLEKNMPVLGIEPAENVAQRAIAKGIDTIVDFFGESLAKKLSAQKVQGDLVLGNNVLAHVPDLNDFVEGLKVILAEGGLITMEFPHLLRLMSENQFDTIYHEHFSYFSLTTVMKVFEQHKLRVFDVEELSTHGGSLRIFACHSDDASKEESFNISRLISDEQRNGLDHISTYLEFSSKAKRCKRDFLDFLINAKNENKTIVAYGAAAKGNTLLNYCGIRDDFIDYVVDRSHYKQGRFLPGTHIPVYSPEKISETQPDYIIILPWNLSEEIMQQLSYVRAWGGQFVVPVPGVKVLP